MRSISGRSFCRIVVGVVAGDAAKFAVEHADDFGRLVVDDAPRLLVPQRRHRDLAGVVRARSPCRPDADSESR